MIYEEEPTMSVNNIPTLNTSYYRTVHQAADKNKDGKVSLEELQALKTEYEGIRTFVYDPELAKRQQAVGVLVENFGVFANNRGLPPGMMRTMDFQVGEDDHVRLHEIEAIALRDGVASNISQQDVTGEAQTPGPTPLPHPRPRPRRRTGLLPLPPQIPPQVRQFLQQLLPRLLQLFAQANPNGLPQAPDPWQQSAGNSNPWFS